MTRRDGVCHSPVSFISRSSPREASLPRCRPELLRPRRTRGVPDRRDRTAATGSAEQPGSDDARGAGRQSVPPPAPARPAA